MCFMDLSQLNLNLFLTKICMLCWELKFCTFFWLKLHAVLGSEDLYLFNLELNAVLENKSLYLFLIKNCFIPFLFKSCILH